MTYHNFDNIDSGFLFNEPLLISPNLIENDVNNLLLNEEDNRRYYIHNENIFQDTNMKQIMITNYTFDNRTSDITDKSLCLTASQCEYKNGKCIAKCSKHTSQEKCKSDSSCRLDNENSRCTNSSKLPSFKLISIIMIILFLI